VTQDAILQRLYFDSAEKKRISKRLVRRLKRGNPNSEEIL